MQKEAKMGNRKKHRPGEQEEALSDQKNSTRLEGFQIARRTVTKYR